MPKTKTKKASGRSKTNPKAELVSDLDQRIWGVIGDGEALLTHATYDEANTFILNHAPKSDSDAKVKMTLVTSDAAQRASAGNSSI